MADTISKEFSAIFRDLVVAFQPRGMDREAPRVYFAALGEFPIDLLRQAATRLARTKTFFPTTGEWFQAALEVQRDARRALAAEPAPLDGVECDRCGDTGSVYGECPGDATCGRPYQHAAHGFVCICACRQTNQSYQRKRAAADIARSRETE